MSQYGDAIENLFDEQLSAPDYFYASNNNFYAYLELLLDLIEHAEHRITRIACRNGTPQIIISGVFSFIVVTRGAGIKIIQHGAPPQKNQYKRFERFRGQRIRDGPHLCFDNILAHNAAFAPFKHIFPIKCY